MGKVKKSKR